MWAWSLMWTKPRIHKRDENFGNNSELVILHSPAGLFLPVTNRRTTVKNINPFEPSEIYVEITVEKKQYVFNAKLAICDLRKSNISLLINEQKRTDPALTPHCMMFVPWAI